MSYQDYLNSKEWAEIRKKVLAKYKGLCAICDRKARDVHHKSYAEDVLRGKCLQALIPLCRGCHYYIEFTKGKKNNLKVANRKLKKAQKKFNYECQHCKYKTLLNCRQDRTCPVCDSEVVKLDKCGKPTRVIKKTNKKKKWKKREMKKPTKKQRHSRITCPQCNMVFFC